MTGLTRSTRLRCSYHQERLWFIDRFETANVYPAQPTYHNLPLVLCFIGVLDRALLEQSLDLAIGRHEALRTGIFTEDDVPVQVVRVRLEIELQVEERPHEHFNVADSAHVERLLERSFTPLPLHGEALVSARLTAFAAETNVLLLTVHHIVADRRSLDLLAVDIVSTYELLLGGGRPGTGEPGLQYADFAAWQHELAAADWEPFLLYWRKQLAGSLQALELPIDRARAPIQRFAPAELRFAVDPQRYREAEAFAVLHGLSSRDVLMGAFILLLHRYSGLPEINIGHLLPNRHQAGTGDIVGPLANLVALRTRVDATAPVAQFLADLKRVVRDAEKYQDLPYEKLVLELAPAPDMSRTALFDVVFLFEQAVALPPIRGLTVERIETNHGLGKYDLNLLIKAGGDGATGLLVYNTDIYDESTIQRFMRQYTILLGNLVAGNAAAVHALEILDVQERELLLNRFNDTDAAYPDVETLVTLFEQAVARWPDRIAVDHNGTVMSYRELDTRANRLARHLIVAHRIGRGDRVGVSLEKSPQMMVAVLAVLKAGAAYVPVDPAYPQRRRQLILDDSDCRLLLVDRESEPSPGLTTLNLTTADCGEGGEGAAPRPDDAAYVIYTSGSTGAPKGCDVSHRNVVRLMKNERHDFDFTEHDVWIMAHSLSFDFSVWEIWGALLYGGKLILPAPSRNQDLTDLYRLIVEGRVTVLNQTPDSFYLLSTLALQDHAHDLADHLRYVVLGGAKLDPTRLRAWLQEYPLKQIRLINMYGITETTVHVTFYALQEKDVLSARPVSIVGRPLPETKVLVLDALGHLSPLGVWGEIHVGGTGVARGYLNHPELTRERFVERPELVPGRLYGSGDIGRWLEGGVIEYLGRRDSQIKIRGFRIECGEVAFYLEKHPGIREAVVVSRLNPATATADLVAYYTESGGERMAPAGLREHLADLLPGHMIPSLFVPVPRIPLSTSGKVDLQALPAAPIGTGQAHEHAPPRTPAERIITAIWERCLGRQGIGLHDNYFDLGGHSLTAVRIVAEVNRESSLEMRLSDIFLYPTVAQLVAHLAGQARASPLAPTPLPRQDAYPASRAQRRLWAHAQFDAAGNAYNVPACFRLRGDLDVAALGGAFEDLAARHESLRTYFTHRGGILEQRIAPDCHAVLRVIDYSREPEREALAQAYVRAEAAAPFELAKAPLFRVALLELDRHEYVFVFTIHHLISDGWSLDVLQRELSGLYHARRANVAPALEPLPYQYKDFADWQGRMLGTEALAPLQSYWQRKLAPPLEARPLRGLVTAMPEPGFAGDTLTFTLAPGLEAGLRAQARLASGSLFMVLLAHVKLLLFRYTGERDIVVGTPATARALPGLEDQIGCYINMLPLRDDIDGTRSFTELLGQVRQTALEGFDHQMYPPEPPIEEPGATANPGGNPFFSVAVMLQNQVQGGLVLQDVEVTPLPVKKDVSLFDLVFEFREGGAGVALHLSYRTALFARERMERLWTHFETLVTQALERPDSPVASLAMLAPAETARLHSLAAAAPSGAAPGPTLDAAFAAVCARRPDQPAVVADGRSISYAELDRRSDAVAQALISAHGIQPEDVVGLLFEPSIETVTAILGVLKAGAAYLPLDPRWPESRVAFILNDSRCKLVLSAASIHAIDPAPGTLTLPRRTAPGKLAYVIYTSGSTGQPKGVMVEHGAVLNLVGGLDVCLYDGARVALQIGCVASLVFDASVQQIFAALLLGHTLHMIPHRLQRSPAELIDLLRTNAIEVLDLTPSLFRGLLRVSPAGDLAPALRRLIIGGEPLPPALVNAFHAGRRNRGVVITNVYGPTECTVDVLWYDCLPDVARKTMPVGRPLPGTRIYLLDGNAEQVPLGDPGEICIGGPALARGYVGEDPRLAGKFAPAASIGEARLYRTGDLGRWNQDGDLEVLGRLDRQIKLRGYRIELGEIESRLLQYPGVQAAVVALTGENENQSLRAWVVSSAPLNEPLLEAYLREHLPAYMVPAACIEIPAVPLSSSGKVDLAALPGPEPAAASGLPDAQTATEAALAGIWAAVLELDQDAIDHRKTFFELGGNSLTSVYVVAEIQERLGVDLRLTELYRHPKLRSLALFIDQRRVSPQPHVRPAGAPATFDLTFQQKRIWIQCERAPGGTAYHMPGSIAFDREPDCEAVRRALAALAKRHEALRLRFVRVGHKLQQTVAAPAEPRLEIVDLSAVGDHEAARQRVIREMLLEPFALETGPLCRFVVLLAPGRYELLYNFHHLVVDGWSLEVLKEEFHSLYADLVSNTPSRLKPVRYDYSDFVGHHLQALRDPAGLEAASHFWANKLAEGRPRLHTPGATAAPCNARAGLGYGSRLRQPLRDALQARARAWNTTVPVVMFSAYLQVLRRFHATDTVAAYLIHAGRDYSQFLNTVGVFMHPLLVVSRLFGGRPFEQQVTQVNREIQALLGHHAYPVELVLERLGMPVCSTPFAFNMLDLPSASGQPVLSDFGDYRREDGPAAKFPLELYVAEYRNGLELYWSFDGRHHDSSAVEYLSNEYVSLLGQLSSSTPVPSSIRRSLTLPGGGGDPPGSL